MVRPAPSFDPVGLLTLSEIRGFVRRYRLAPLAALCSIAYALGSMLWGGMLTLAPVPGGTTVELLTGSGTGGGSWNYPGLLVVGPWGVLSLPFFATFAMVVVAVGVGLGMAVAVGLIWRLLRPSPDEVARTKAVGALTGLTPAMISLVTLGSCCTTTAAATGGIGLIAQASGTTTSNLLLNNWYLGAAQIAIVWAALFGQELLLGVYGGLLGLRSGGARAYRPVAPPVDRRWALGAALRGVLAIGGILWSISMLAEWTTRDPLSAGAGWWFRWLAQHQLLAALAVGAAFFPAGAYRLAQGLRRGIGRPLAVLFAAVAASLLVWLPAPFPAWGFDSLADQLLGVLGAPASWGAIPVGPVTGAALVARWALEYAVPAGFVLVSVIDPDLAFAPLVATVTRFEPAPEVSSPADLLAGTLARPPSGELARRASPEQLSGTGPPPEAT